MGTHIENTCLHGLRADWPQGERQKTNKHSHTLPMAPFFYRATHHTHRRPYFQRTSQANGTHLARDYGWTSEAATSPTRWSHFTHTHTPRHYKARQQTEQTKNVELMLRTNKVSPLCTQIHGYCCDPPPSARPRASVIDLTFSWVRRGNGRDRRVARVRLVAAVSEL